MMGPVIKLMGLDRFINSIKPIWLFTCFIGLHVATICLFCEQHQGDLADLDQVLSSSPKAKVTPLTP
jgi:hypothetical protein